MDDDMGASAAGAGDLPMGGAASASESPEEAQTTDSASDDETTNTSPSPISRTNSAARHPKLRCPNLLIHSTKKLTSRERPKSAPYLRLKKTRKPLFLQLETTKALKKLKIEKKNFRFFFEFFSKFPVSRIVPKNVKGGTLFISC